MNIYSLELNVKIYKVIEKAIMTKKITIGIFLLISFNGCAPTTAFLGPVYTLGATGNVYQAGLSYSSNKAITRVTGKSPEENIKDFLIHKKTDSKLEKLVKKQITETRKKLGFVQ